MQPLVATVPLQIFACEVATVLGHDVDQPRNLAKSVTVEVIVGVGIDVVDVARFEQTLERTPGLRTRLFTAATRRDRPVASLAARFAAKEALAKALGAPAGLHWIDAEVVTADDGRPHLVLSGSVAATRRRRSAPTHVHVSLSPRRRDRLGGRGAGERA